MKNWQYTDSSNRVVSRTHDDGKIESCLASELDPSITPDPFEPTPPSVEQQIIALEATMTPRRIREASKDPTWMNALDAQIAALRTKP